MIKIKIQKHSKKKQKKTHEEIERSKIRQKARLDRKIHKILNSSQNVSQKNISIIANSLLLKENR